MTCQCCGEAVDPLSTDTERIADPGLGPLVPGLYHVVETQRENRYGGVDDVEELCGPLEEVTGR